MHVGHSLTSCSEGSPEDHEKQSGDDDDLVHPRQVRRVLQGTAAPNRADTSHTDTYYLKHNIHHYGSLQLQHCSFLLSVVRTELDP